jgi:alpha-beta hydrolase superfamily lysophospholipase
VDRAVVFGHSMGGLVALTLTADRVAAVDNLVVAAAAVMAASQRLAGRCFLPRL